MTMPNHNLSDTPKDVLTVGNLGNKTQNLNPTKVKGTSQGRMSSGFLGSTGGLTSGLATTATNLFGSFMGDIADDTTSTTVGSPEDVSDQVQSFFGNPASKLFDSILGFFSPILQGITTGLTGVAAFVAGLFGLRWAQVDQHDDDIAAVAGSVTGLQNRVTNLESGGQVTAFASSGSWPIPPTGFVTFSVINGGGAGATSSGDNGGAGGSGGGFISQPFACEDLRALGTTASFTIGAGASASNGQAGGVSKVMIGATNILVGVATPRGSFGSAIGTGGALLSNGHGTAGGRGASYDGSTTVVGERGESSGVASGGLPGTGNGDAGADGAPGPDLTYALAGGAGGGGGYAAANFATSGRGGDGGSPGGAGGGAGHARALGASSGRRGYGANGGGMAYWQPTL